MKLIKWEELKGLSQLLVPGRGEPAQKAARIVAMQLHIVFPAKAGLIAVVVYYLTNIGWFETAPTPHTVALELLQQLIFVYIFCNAMAVVFFAFWRRFHAGLFLWLAFTLGLLDGLFLAGVVFRTGGFESIAFWVFPGLIVLNALSIPLAMPQIVLNLLLSVFYASAGILSANISDTQAAIQNVPRRSITNRPPVEAFSKPGILTNQNSEITNKPRRPAFWPEDFQTGAARMEIEPDQTSVETVVLRVVLLWFLTVCCYAVQVLAERQRQVEEEAHEMGLRQGQLRSAGRLAAEFAHQIKNPLAIINNAAFSLQRALKEGRGDPIQHLQIIQEEIDRSDKIVTRIMGYAQLNEGHVEKLDLAHELSLAIAQVFPLAAEFPVKIECRCEPDLPPLLMQRAHLDEILVNIFQNARDALGQAGGKLSASARRLAENLIEISISNTGPEIPADKLEKIFEAHYTTKEKGTGLGLAIVKHNVELYAGSVRAESKLGKGVRFVLVFPAKTVINPDKKFQTS